MAHTLGQGLCVVKALLSGETLPSRGIRISSETDVQDFRVAKGKCVDTCDGDFVRRTFRSEANKCQEKRSLNIANTEQQDAHLLSRIFRKCTNNYISMVIS